MSEQFSARPLPATRPAPPEPPARQPAPAYPPLWWLRPFLAGLILGLSLLAVELIFRWSENARRQAMDRNDKIQQQYEQRRAP